MIRRTMMKMKERDRIVHENQGRCFWRFHNLIFIILYLIYYPWQFFWWKTFFIWSKNYFKIQKIVKKLTFGNSGNQVIYFTEFCDLDNLTLEHYFSISRSRRNMLLVFLEFLGHGEFKFQKSCQKLYPSLRY